MHEKKNAGAATAAGRSAYEAKVGAEAVLRSGGKNPQLKGVVHEVLYRDSVTLNPGNVANGTVGVRLSIGVAEKEQSREDGVDELDGFHVSRSNLW